MGQEKTGRLIVADTGPLIRLEEIQAWRLLEPFAPVKVPTLVAQECRQRNVPLTSEWLELLSEAPPQQAAQRMHPFVAAGMIQPADAEAIAWCISSEDALLLTDDAAARSVAEASGVEVRGSIGVLLYNAVLGLIDRDAAMRMLAKIASSSLWVSRGVIVEAERLLKELM